ncbi:hypothetical protein SteCoe_35664 [Stentor coeruleus]|uniref:Uncharacterized protein n=1 Tax=Stentor coeruleus TaxID=5963 RepID=A0A1R2ARW3_9CILI|nr:hypothetical protein SteCoe_35664 [Stentor coeruleus]
MDRIMKEKRNMVVNKLKFRELFSVRNWKEPYRRFSLAAEIVEKDYRRDITGHLKWKEGSEKCDRHGCLLSENHLYCH